MSREAVLFANEAFYRAFADRDLAAMDAVWLSEGSVACIHPGWPALHERGEIMQTWQRIFANPENHPPTEVRGLRCVMLGDAAFVICYEVFGEGALIATNLFRRVGARWQMVHHQASPTSNLPQASDDEEDADERVLN